MTVYLVGAGPGDPGLLTLRGAEVLGTADVVVYDRLSVAALLELAPARAERISVAKSAGRAVMDQTDINALLVERGRRGERVVRLKGGDPFVFARGGEEAAALSEAGVPYEVVPGITSAIAVPAYAGIPVTLRHSSTSFTVVTGHEQPGKDGEVDWESVAKVGGTIVVLMGVGRLPAIVERLLAGGLSPDTPAAAVRWGTRPEQHTVRATLATLADHPLEAPSVIVIGAVAATELDWFESRPLLGWRVAVTRPAHQASGLAAPLRHAGAEPVLVPTIEVVDPDDGGVALRSSLADLGDVAWLVLTSANGAARVCAALRDGRDLAGVRIAAIGPGTAEELARHHLVADLVPERFVAESLLEAFPGPEPGAGPGGRRRVLLARAAVARDVLPEGLAAKGWEVEVVAAYRTRPVAPDDEQRDAAAGCDAVTFTSSSTVERWVEAFGVDRVPPVVACIGPVTAATARRLGLHVDVEADEHTIDGLVGALVDHAARAGRPPRAAPAPAGGDGGPAA